MVNYILGFFLISGIIYGVFTGNSEIINNEILNSGSVALKLVLQFIPLMCLWLGIMNIAKVSGLLDKVSLKLSPILMFIFPEIPKGDEALGIISSNIVMNMVGLGNAATPFGLKAMKEMSRLNNNKDTASRSMITFLVINTSSVTIVPTTVISLRLLNGSSNATEILSASIIVTVLSCVLGLIVDRLFYFLNRAGIKHE